jgi:hypothetical protein
MAPGRDIHVTSNAIKKAGQKLITDVKPDIETASANIDKTEVGLPSFGIIGIGIQMGHHEMQTYARNYFKAAADCLDRFNSTLGTIARTWRDAEDKSTTKVQN